MQLKKCGWAVHQYDDSIEIENWSPKGENLVYELGIDTLLDDLREIYEYYDPEEHVETLIIAKQNGLSGVPCASALVYDSEKIDEMLSDLLNAVQEAMEQ